MNKRVIPKAVYNIIIFLVDLCCVSIGVTAKIKYNLPVLVYAILTASLLEICYAVIRIFTTTNRKKDIND